MAWDKIGNLKGPPGDDGTDGTNGSDGADGNDAVWTQLTQEQYDALDPPDANTLYIIVG